MTPKRSQPSRSPSNHLHLPGWNAVTEALKANLTIEDLYLRTSATQGNSSARDGGQKKSSSRQHREVVEELRSQGTRIHNVSHSEIANRAGTEHHQGVLGVTPHHFLYRELDEILSAMRPHGILIALDNLQDPHNLGAIVRTGMALGAQGFIIPKDRSAGVSPGSIRSSAGTILRAPIARVTNMARTLKELNERFLETVLIEPHQAQSIHNLGTIPTQGRVLVFGSEQQGCRPWVRKQCQYQVSIPMAAQMEAAKESSHGVPANDAATHPGETTKTVATQGVVESLNVSVAAGIALYTCFHAQSGNGPNPKTH